MKSLYRGLDYPGRAPSSSTRRRRWIQALSAGVLLGLSFPPFPFPLFAFVAFVPILSVWEHASDWRSAYMSALLAYLATFAVAFQWPIFHVLPATAIMSLPPLVLLPMWLALPFGISHAVGMRLGRSIGLVAFVALHVLAEIGLRAGALAFPWTLVGHTQVSTAGVNHLAAFGGVPLITVVVLVVNVLIFLLWQSRGAAWSGARRTHAGRHLGNAALVLAAPIGIVAIWVYGWDTGRATRQAIGLPDGGTFRVAGIQPAYPPDVWADLEDSTRVRHLLRLTRDMMGNADPLPDLVVWPETAIPPRPRPSTYYDQVRVFSDSARVVLLTGAITTTSGEDAYRNSAILFAPGEEPRQYDKVNLVPFAERVPFVSRFPILDPLAVPSGGVRGYEPGHTRGIFKISGRTIGVLICFETLFDAPARELVRRHAEAVVAITQDGWWGDSFGYRQHLAFNRLRAIETGVPMLQASVSGISALILPDGRVHELGGWMEQVAWETVLPGPAPPPPYVRWGDWVSLLAVITVVLIFGLYGWNMPSRGVGSAEASFKE